MCAPLKAKAVAYHKLGFLVNARQNCALRLNLASVQGMATLPVLAWLFCFVGVMYPPAPDLRRPARHSWPLQSFHI